MSRLNWETKPLKELCSAIGDGIHATPNYTDNSGYYFINGNNLKNGFITITDNTKQISREEYDKYYLDLDDNSLLMSINGTLGSLALFRGERVALGKSAAYINCKSIDRIYCYYYLRLDSAQQKMWNDATGSTIKNLSLESLKNFPIHFPKIEDQQRIASVLSALDAKIELNQRIIAELESMAKTLYDYWFVQFDFPNEKGQPYKTSGGKMVWNDVLKRDIPLGWEVKSLSEITRVSTESLNPMNFPDYDFRHYSIPSFDEIGTYKIEKGGIIMSNKFSVLVSDILVSKLNPWFSRVVYTTDESNLVCSTEFVVWRTSDFAIKNYLYMIARDSSFKNYCTKSATGTSNSHKRVNPDVMMRYKVAYDKDQAMKFGDTINSIIRMVTKNKVEIKTLIELRDWLLPLLMNGQVKIRN